MQARALSTVLPIGVLLGGLSAGCIINIDSGVADWSDGYEYSPGGDRAGSHRIEGSGIQASEVRLTEAFDAVELSGSFDIEIRSGQEQSVTVHGDENVLPYVVTDVTNGVLDVYLECGRYETNEPLRVEVQVADLRAFTLSGSGDARISGVDRRDFALSLSGSGKVRAAGSAEFMSVWLSGSGDLNLRDLEVREADVQISGSGDVELAVSERLDTRVSGSGDVRYSGKPTTSARVSGSGTVRPSRR